MFGTEVAADWLESQLKLAIVPDGDKEIYILTEISYKPVMAV